MREMTRPRRPELTPRALRCTTDGAPHVELRARLLRSGEIVELIAYTCGHTSRRVVSRILPEFSFIRYREGAR